jgi:hypothetical protein
LRFQSIIFFRDILCLRVCEPPGVTDSQLSVTASRRRDGRSDRLPMKRPRSEELGEQQAPKRSKAALSRDNPLNKHYLTRPDERSRDEESVPRNQKDDIWQEHEIRKCLKRKQGRLGSGMPSEIGDSQEEFSAIEDSMNDPTQRGAVADSAPPKDTRTPRPVSPRSSAIMETPLRVEKEAARADRRNDGSQQPPSRRSRGVSRSSVVSSVSRQSRQRDLTAILASAARTSNRF